MAKKSTDQSVEQNEVAEAKEQVRQSDLASLVAALQHEVSYLKSLLDKPKGYQESQAIARRAREIVERNRKLAIRVDSSGKPTGVQALTSYEPHVLIDPPKPNWAVWTKVANRIDRKKIGEFRKKPILFYSEHTDPDLASADYKKLFGVQINPKTQVLKPHAGK